MDFALETTDLETAGLRRGQIDRLIGLIGTHITDGRYSGAQIAIARHGKLALFRSFGNARAGEPAGGRHAVAAVFQHQGGYRGGHSGFWPSGARSGSPTASPTTFRTSPATASAT